MRKKLVILILAALLPLGCGRPPERPVPVGEPVIFGPKVWGNAEGYLGPHLSGVSIPVQLDRSLSLAEMAAAIDRCLSFSIERLKLQLFQRAFDTSPGTDRKGVRFDPNDRTTLVYETHWNIASDFPLPTFTAAGTATYPVAIIDKGRAKKGEPFSMLVLADGKVRKLTLPAGLPQFIYRLHEAAPAAPAATWLADMTLRFPATHHFAVPVKEGDESSAMTFNTLAYAECLLMETMRYNRE